MASSRTRDSRAAAANRSSRELAEHGLPEPVLRQLAGKAGFADVRHVEMDNPFNKLYELTR